MKQLSTIVFTALMVTLFSSCSKEETAFQIKDNVQVGNERDLEYQFFYNDEPSGPIELNNESLRYLTNADYDEDETLIGYTIRAYSEDDLYSNFGRANDLPLAELILFEDAIHIYIEENGTEAYYEEHGEYPSDYVAFEEELYVDLFGEYENRSSNFFWDGNMSQGAMTILPGASATMVYGIWNDRVGSFRHFHVAGFVTVYDRMWYRGFRDTFWGVYWQQVNFQGWFAVWDNEVSSEIAVGIGL